MTGAVWTGTVSVAVNAPTVCVALSGIDAVVRKWATVFYSTRYKTVSIKVILSFTMIHKLVDTLVQSVWKAVV